jgi:hypothetical protein
MIVVGRRQLLRWRLVEVATDDPRSIERRDRFG